MIAAVLSNDVPKKNRSLGPGGLGSRSIPAMAVLRILPDSQVTVINELRYLQFACTLLIIHKQAPLEKKNTRIFTFFGRYEGERGKKEG
jgi:hypothetical protein